MGSLLRCEILFLRVWRTKENNLSGRKLLYTLAYISFPAIQWCTLVDSLKFYFSTDHEMQSLVYTLPPSFLPKNACKFLNAYSNGEIKMAVFDEMAWITMHAVWIPGLISWSLLNRDLHILKSEYHISHGIFSLPSNVSLVCWHGSQFSGMR